MPDYLGGDMRKMKEDDKEEEKEVKGRKICIFGLEINAHSMLVLPSHCLVCRISSIF